MPVVRSIVRRSADCAALLSLSCGCGDLEDCPGVTNGAHIQLEILGEIENPPADLADSIECGKAWGIVPGLIIDGTITRHGGTVGCKPGILEGEILPGWTWSMLPVPLDHGGVTLMSSYAVNNGTCFAAIDLSLKGAQRNRPYCNVESDRTCFLRLGIAKEDYRPDNGVCPQACGLYLNVRPSLL